MLVGVQEGLSNDNSLLYSVCGLLVAFCAEGGSCSSVGISGLIVTESGTQHLPNCLAFAALDYASPIVLLSPKSP